MKHPGRHIMHGVLKGLSHMPWRVMYVLSDVLAALLYHVVRYRRRVVRDNLEQCFPDKDRRWIRRTAHDFYRSFTDSILETVKLMSISDKELMERCRFVGVEHADALMREGRSVVAYFAHTGNWEWATSYPLHSTLQGNYVYGQIYRPLKNAVFDALMLGLRSRHGSQSLPKHTALRSMLEMRRRGTVSITGFMSDQKTSHGDDWYVHEFLGRPTDAITGTETLARRLGMAVVYWDLERTARGHYRITIRHITDDASATPPHVLTDRYLAMLEQTIRRQPHIWLWSHDRWKNVRKKEQQQ